jgi:hypothetical protein
MHKRSPAILAIYNMLKELEKEKAKKHTPKHTKDSLKSFVKITLQEK